MYATAPSPDLDSLPIISLYQLSDDPYPLLAKLRRRAPVAWFEEAGAWLVTSRALVLEVLRDTDTFTTDDPMSAIQQTFGRHMLSTDGDEQKRYKAACIVPFSKKVVAEELAAAVRAKGERLLQAFIWRNQADLRTVLTGRLSVFSTGYVLGIPEEFNETILEWYDRFAAALLSFGANPAARVRGLAAADEFRRAMRPLLERARTEPSGGLFSGLVHAADRLSDEQILANALIILFGGIETTDSMMTNAIWALLTHPDQLAAVRADPALRANAIEESLRWEPAVQSCTRFVTRDTRIGGVEVRAGQVVQCMLSGANRDPLHFPDPDRFDVRRSNPADHLAFGIGRHLCLGSHLARLETRVAVDLVLDSLPMVRLDPDHPARPTGYEFRKPASLEVRWESPLPVADLG